MSTKPQSRTGCLLCGEPLEYLREAATLRCALCEEPALADARCTSGHYVCDVCHRSSAVEVIERTCLATSETDMLRLAETIRAHPSFSMHGPEHHALVPAVILATYRNLGGEVSAAQLRTAMKRGHCIPGGFCGRVGACGAAVGVGAAFGIMLASTPLTPDKRQMAQQVVARVIEAQSRWPAARCCRRETLVVLMEAAQLSRDLLPIPLRAGDLPPCQQHETNKECIPELCPAWPANC